MQMLLLPVPQEVNALVIRSRVTIVIFARFPLLYTPKIPFILAAEVSFMSSFTH